jgi:hypothetical protein
LYRFLLPLKAKQSARQKMINKTASLIIIGLLLLYSVALFAFVSQNIGRVRAGEFGKHTLAGIIVAIVVFLSACALIAKLAFYGI